MLPAPLQSGNDRSDPGFNRRLEADRRLIEQHMKSGTIHMTPNRETMILKVEYPPHDGATATGPYLRIGLCTGTATRVIQQVGTARLEGVWRPGALVITPPDCSGWARCGRLAMIGLAIAPGATPMARPIAPDLLQNLAGSFIDDAVMTSLLTTLYYEADTHGVATAFFEHGIARTLQRLEELGERLATRREALPLAKARLDRLLAFVDSRLGDEIPVAGMAAAAGMDASGFTRALKARTGLSPYASLTERRMERATGLLAEGLAVTHVASALGYANAGKFAAAFRRVMNCSPSQWVRKSRGT